MSDYLQEQIAGITAGAGDVITAGIADIADSYQEILMADASISPPDPLPEPVEYVQEPTNNGLDMG